uniref:Cell division cycle associated 3 n=1 Tax=Jaculus jaculus TaxID=51337 RepID=A0A8C5JZX5_JACJA
MGSTQSVPVTPAPHNKHLARVADPRSPSAGIQRTPIQVESSPQASLPAEELKSPTQAQDSDPRSPTLGIARTPMKASGVEVFSEVAKQSTETPVAIQSSEKSLRDPETPQSSGSKCNRRKANSKVLGRSPLTILQDDNSPGTLTLRQGKRPSPLIENARELKEGTILGTGRLLRTGGRTREQGQDHDKENEQFALVES